ncbi:hypothetical protein HU761_25955 [Pseudomonas sp. SWRI59]|uniref:hypothetical protein n=1 Tax=unclassified Pseudomonas TaxID=196821 RepID=UPI001644F439|nr:MULTISPECIES: hypothetical protein [unclassified Pseudomonas]MBC3504831.1 hypothetical protein [Pseudomonas sp. SWRI59]MBC3509019.1 hypothetical protein [Pseudomonas sp. SWRI68]
MIRIRPLSLCLALALGVISGTSFAATEPTNTDSHPQTDQSGGKTAGDDSSVNSPGSGQDNDSSNTGTSIDAADGASGGSNSTGEATGSGAGSSGGTAEDQDSR